jgi:glycosyltransferase involved in cell wall biosynthesis
MDVVVCGAQFPFMHGGAELHMENLVRAFQAAGHRADLVRLPTAWDRVRIFDAAMAWRLLPIDADLVVATNFPSYFVRHDRKVVWLFHQHRGAYDALDSSWSDFGLDDAGLDAHQRLVEWDNRALDEATRLFSTSHEVARRLRHFNGLTAEPLYHPPPLYEALYEGPARGYVLSATRLESNKRPDLLVQAAAHVTSGTTVAIAGTGSLRDAIARMAEPQRGRVDLLGFVDDEVLVDRYAHALAVAYVPLQEDFGYVTLQAFFAAKPVITTTDSGGVLEWVEDGVTGLVVEPEPAAIAAAVDALARDPDRARAMGKAGRERVADLDWTHVVERLTG